MRIHLTFAACSLNVSLFVTVIKTGQDGALDLISANCAVGSLSPVSKSEAPGACALPGRLLAEFVFCFLKYLIWMRVKFTPRPVQSRRPPIECLIKFLSFVQEVTRCSQC